MWFYPSSMGIKLCADFWDVCALSGEDLEKRIHQIIRPWHNLCATLPLALAQHCAPLAQPLCNTCTNVV